MSLVAICDLKPFLMADLGLRHNPMRNTTQKARSLRGRALWCWLRFVFRKRWVLLYVFLPSLNVDLSFLRLLYGSSAQVVAGFGGCGGVRVERKGDVLDARHDVGGLNEPERGSVVGVNDLQRR